MLYTFVGHMLRTDEEREYDVAAVSEPQAKFFLRDKEGLTLAKSTKQGWALHYNGYRNIFIIDATYSIRETKNTDFELGEIFRY